MAPTRAAVSQTNALPPFHLRHGVGRGHLLSPFIHQGRRVLSVVAPAGYGKTRLLAQLAHRVHDEGTDVAWLSLDDRHRRYQQFVTEFLQAVSQGAPYVASRFPDPAMALADRAEVVRALTATQKPLLIVLDDVHFLDDPSWEWLGFLLREGPPWLSFAIAGRVSPALDCATLRLNDSIVEIGKAQLAFAPNEALFFFESQGLASLSRDEVAALQEKTEGWPAALQLAAVALKEGRVPLDAISEFGAHEQLLSEYLLNEVFHNMPQGVRDFLLKTAILEKLSPDLCNAVTGESDAHHHLAEIERLNLFLWPLDPERKWFRYHALFADFLCQRLASNMPAKRVERLHRRAAAWFNRHGYMAEAVHHCFAASDFKGVVRILNKHCDEFYYTGHYGEVLHWLERLPPALLRHQPRLLLNRVWALVHEWRFAEAESLIRTVRRNRGEEADHGQELEALIAHRRGMKLMVADRLLSARDVWRRLLSETTFDDPYLQGSADVAFAFSQYNLYSYKAARDHAARGEQLFRSNRQHCGKIWSDTFASICLIGIGEAGQVEDILRGAVEAASEHAGAHSSFVALPALTLAGFLYERNRLGEAVRLVQLYLNKATTLGVVDQLIAGYVAGMRLADMGRLHEEVAEIFARGLDCAAAHGFSRLRAHLVEERLRGLGLQGDVSGFLALARREGLLDHGTDGFYPGRLQTSADEARALARARVAFRLDDASGAVSVLRAWIAFLRRRGYRRSDCNFNIVLADMLFRLDCEEEGLDRLWDAIRIAAETGTIRPFLDEGDVVVARLGELASRRGLSATEASHLRIVLDQCPPELLRRSAARAGLQPDGERPQLHRAGAPLKLREREVLRRIAQGMTNGEVAGDLSLAVGTVNWYVHQIYQKLGVHRRTHAVSRARDQGLL